MMHVHSDPARADHWTDPIVAEVRAAREAFAARYDYDVDRIVAALVERTKAGGRTVVGGATTTDRPASPQPPRAP